jgi:hypothetical protein
LPQINQADTKVVMAMSKVAPGAAPATARTIRFPKRLRDRIAADAERCGRSFEAQVLAILRRHFGESACPKRIAACSRAD